MPALLDAVLGGWQYTAAGRFYSGRPVFFNTSYVVTGNPKLDNPTRDKWFDTTMFAVQDTFTPRTNPVYYEGLNGPGSPFVDMTLTKSFKMGPRYRLEARLEAYNVFNTIVWDQPEVNLRQRQLRQGHAQARRRPGPRDSDRPAVRVLVTDSSGASDR